MCCSHIEKHALTTVPRPDNCDGSYEATCDKSRQYSNISAILQAGAPETLAYMKTYWKDYKGQDESFWSHEFGKHGTCISTLDPPCYTDYKPTQEAVDFFNKAVSLFQALPSYEWLAAAGIKPSTSQTYTLAAVQAALKAKHGQDVVINCKGGELNELWYHYNVQGSVQDGKFSAAAPVGSGSTCPKTGIKYLPKSGGGGGGGSSPTTSKPSIAKPTTPAGPAPTGAPGALSGKGRFSVSAGGFLVGSGAWYKGGGTPATFTATPGNGATFTLSSSKGKCGVQNDALTCGSGVSEAAAFGYDGTGLTYNGASTFYAAAAPSGNAQAAVSTKTQAVSFQITWTAV